MLTTFSSINKYVKFIALFEASSVKQTEDGIQVCTLSLGHAGLISSTVSKTTLIRAMIFWAVAMPRSTGAEQGTG